MQGSHPHRRYADGAYCPHLPSVWGAPAVPARGGLSRSSLDGRAQETCGTSSVSVVSSSAESNTSAVVDGLMLGGRRAKYPTIAQAKVNQGTEQNRDAVREKDWKVCLLHEKSQNRKIPHQ